MTTTKTAIITFATDEHDSGIFTAYAVDARDRYTIATGHGYTERAARLHAQLIAVSEGST